MEGIKIEFGGGDRPTYSHYKQCDVRGGADYQCSAIDIDSFVEEGTCSHLFSRHFFEHMTFAQGEKYLTICMKLLMPGGKIEMILPNLDFHIRQMTERKDIPGTIRDVGWKKHALASIFGWQREGLEKLWDVHKAGYNKEIFLEVADKLGIQNVEFLKTANDRDLHIVITK